MLNQILIGSLVIFGTVLVQTACISSINVFLIRIDGWIYHSVGFFKNAVLLSVIVLWLVIGLVITCCLWAYVYLFVDASTSLEAALYFSIVTFATLGYGDIVVDTNWRLLISLTALNGVIILGLNTAFLAHTLSHIRTNQLARSDNASVNKTTNVGSDQRGRASLIFSLGKRIRFLPRGRIVDSRLRRWAIDYLHPQVAYHAAPNVAPLPIRSLIEAR